MTPYDRAHALMQAEPENEAKRLAVYDRLADAELFLLLEEEPEDENIKPQVFAADEGDFVLVFDTEERMAEFADAAQPYAALPGRVIAQHLVGEGIGLGVNLGVAESAMLLPPEALDWLTETLANTPAQAQGRPVSFSAPALSPAVLALLMPAYQVKLDQLAGIAQAAVLGGVTYDDGHRGHVLAVIGAHEHFRPGIAKAMGEALTFSGLDAGELDVTFLEPNDASAKILLDQGLVLYIPEPVEEEVQEITPGAAPGMDPTKPPILR
ncbi:SseB family protein [Thioclava sp. 15-R06ZXC-3]|uniref:SseB family protein n=1 Tax=Thioclava arctica TaxID=3238301 RepID=A0ABV3TFJ1_9RHOB